MSEMDFMDESSEEGYLTGQLLLAMPTMSDPRFERSVIYMCAHTDNCLLYTSPSPRDS